MTCSAPRLATKVKVARRCGSGHVRALQPGELYCEYPHGARSAMHQHTLSGLEFSEVEQALPCRQGSDGNRSGLDVSQTGRLGSNRGKLCDAILRHGSVGIPVIHAEYFLSNLETANIPPGVRYDAGELMTRHGPCTLLACLGVPGRIPEQLR